MRKSTVIAASVAALVAGTVGAVWANTFTLSSKHLGAASVATPQMYPTSLSTTNGGNAAGKAQKFDSLTVTYSNELQASTMCSGAPTTVGTQTLSGATATIGNNTGSTGNDELTVAVPATTCPGAVHFGSVDLGSPSYVSGSAVTFSATIALTQTTTNATLVITLGNASGGTTATVSNGAAQVYTPDPAITDTAGFSVGANLAKSSSTQAF
jgi:hypothetical protein